MKIQLKFFGPLAEITEKTTIEVSEINDTDLLVKKILNDFPKLSNCKFMISVNRKLISENKKLESGNEVAFLSPFSGG